ncbi:MAG: hotdog domain-containing protein, partial [Pseudomonadota bacterium]|nr:hotdog domain-containing protein [Pseudomonadota bacterium]
AQVKQCKALNIAIVSMGRETALFRLPYSQSINGDPESGIVHGGGVSALLEHNAIIKILIEGEVTRFPKMVKMVNLLIEYLRPYLATQDTYAAGTLFKQGRSVISVRVEASQGDSC